MYHIITGTVSGGGLGAQLCPTLVTPRTLARQVPLSLGCSRQEDWTEWPVPAPRDLPDPGIDLMSPAFQADSLLTELWGSVSTQTQKLFQYLSGLSL